MNTKTAPFTDKDGALYDLKNDPWEKLNLYNDPKYAGVISELENSAERWDLGDETIG